MLHNGKGNSEVQSCTESFNGCTSLKTGDVRNKKYLLHEPKPGPTPDAERKSFSTPTCLIGRETQLFFVTVWDVSTTGFGSRSTGTFTELYCARHDYDSFVLSSTGNLKVVMDLLAQRLLLSTEVYVSALEASEDRTRAFFPRLTQRRFRRKRHSSWNPGKVRTCC